MTNTTTESGPPEYGAATGSALLNDDAVQASIARVIAKFAPLSTGQVLYVIKHAKSIDVAIAAIDYGCAHNIDPNDAVRVIREQNVPHEGQVEGRHTNPMTLDPSDMGEAKYAGANEDPRPSTCTSPCVCSDLYTAFRLWRGNAPPAGSIKRMEWEVATAQMWEAWSAGAQHIRNGKN